MAGLRSCVFGRHLRMLPPINTRIHGFRCCSNAPNGRSKETQTPELLKIAVSGVTEILRLFIPAGRGRTDLVDEERKDEVSVSNVDDVLSIIRSDYEKAYFVTGFFTSAIYAEECIFEDPTIKFKGKELYACNLSLLLPFFEGPSIQLKELDKGLDCETISLVASWKLRTYLKLPWKPLICIDGTTTYDLDEEFRIVRHVERWKVSAIEAILQIFTPSRSSDQ
ncbi:adenine phosphoribosyltransferase-like protein [Perilla frutescens var. frutescens]|nr:adenine phosphoribosyltransferase-like protein [Perilla frutescens var. frutescens]